MNVPGPDARGSPRSKAAVMLTVARVLACEMLLAATVAAEGDPTVPSGYTMKNWQTEDGLPQMTATAITQTSDGYLWVGTFNGLSRFDGVRFTSFTMNTTPELASDYITALHEDDEGVLWVGTGEGGLVLYEEGRFEAFSCEEDFSGVSVHAIGEDSQGTIWAGTSRGLIRIGTEDGSRRITEVMLRGEEVLGVGVGPRNEIWLATPKSIHRVAGDQLFGPPIKAPAEVHTLAVDGEGRAWVSYAAGGVGFVSPDGSTLGISSWRGKITCMHPAEDGTLWAGTIASGIGRLDAGSAHYYRSATAITGRPAALYVDREGNLWAGAEVSGLWRLRENAVAALGSKHGLLNSSITSMHQDSNGRVWAGTFGKGLHWWDGTRFTAIRMPTAPNITSLLEDRTGRLWFGTYGGKLGWVEANDTTNDTANDASQSNLKFEEQLGLRTRVLFEDSRGGFWMGTLDRGIEYLEAGQLIGKVKSFSVADGLSHEHVRAIAEDAAGEVWVGTSRGLNRFTKGGIKTYFRADGLAGEQVRALFRDSEGTLWIGSTGGGLTRWRDGQLRSIGTKEGLVNDWIEQIIEDEHGHLWLGSNDGLMRVNLRELNDCVSGLVPFVHCTAFRREEGLVLPHCGTGFQPSCFRAADGKLWFGTDAGIAIIDPARIRSQKRTPPVYIEEILAGQEAQTIPGTAGKLELKAGTQRLEIRYTGLDFSAAELVRFRYKLEGFDTDWVNAGTRREAVYTRVPPGEYQFRVVAGNNQGYWNEEGATLAFTIAPFFWQTRSFQIAVPALGLLLSGLGMRNFFARKHRRQLEMLERKHALDRERSRIAQDMHDGLGSSLVKISLLGEQAESRFSEPAHTQRQVLKMTAAARQVMREMDEIVWAVNPRNDTLENFASYLCVFAREHFCDTPVACHLDIPPELPAKFLRAEVRHNLFLAVREALNNVLKHSHARNVWARMEVTGSELRIEIRDDGRGLPASIRENGNGLGNMRERLRHLGGEMRLEPAATGTKVRFNIPLE